jgi:predicted nucleic acid-binding protein
VTLIDTNVLIDILSDDPNWRAWSLDRLNERTQYGPLLINDVVYAELSSRYCTEQLLDEKIMRLNLLFRRVPKHALFLAGRAFERYRRTGGTRTGVLPDFFIDAHAFVARVPLVTRDVGRYRRYFPDVELIAPEQ